MRAALAVARNYRDCDGCVRNDVRRDWPNRIFARFLGAMPSSPPNRFISARCFLGDVGMRDTLRHAHARLKIFPLSKPLPAGASMAPDQRFLRSFHYPTT